MPIKINGTNTAANPSITGDDTDTGIVYGTNQIDFSTGGTSRAAIDGSGHLKFTGTTEEITLQTSDGSDNGYLNLSGGGACSQSRAAQVVMYGNEVTDNQGKLLLMGGNSGNANGTVDFYSGGSKRMVINSSGRVGVGTTTGAVGGSPSSQTGQFNVVSSAASGQWAMQARADNTAGNGLFLRAGNGSSYYTAYLTGYDENNVHMVVRGDGNVMIGCTATPSASVAGTAFISESSGRRTGFMSSSSTSEMFLFQFFNPNGGVGSIRTNGSATSFQTSSDYRLKENAVAISDGITRLKTLKPYRFNFKADADTTVDGFFAHEVQSVVPEAISGTKDETKDILYTEDDTIPSGKKVGDVKEVQPVYQGIDQSKLVPLLTAALQEAVGKIETLETKVAALEAA